MLLNCSIGEKGDQSWVFIVTTDVEAETPIVWPPDAKSWLIWKVPDAGKVWVQEEKGTTEDMMVGWHHGLDGRESEWPPGVGDGQGGLACCDSWSRKESDTTERLNWTELNWTMSKVEYPYGRLLAIRISFFITNLSSLCILLLDCSPFPYWFIRTLLYQRN